VKAIQALAGIFRGRHIQALPVLGLLALAAGGCASRSMEPPSPQDDLRVYGNPTIELTPVHYAIAHFGAAQATASRGGIPSLYVANGADLAGHAETQALRYSLQHPDLRIILTITEGHYRIVAKRSAGIGSMADLRGKRVATPPASSAAFYLHRALETAGMTDSDVETVAIAMPPRDIAQMLLDGEADAVALWDPEPQIAIERLGDDAVILDPDTGYRELYNLNSTAAQLADPVSRAKIVRFVARLIEASEAMGNDSTGAIELAAQGTGYPAELIRASWPHHVFPATLAPDLLDTLVTEEAWLARREGRPVRRRETLGTLIDPSIEAEARAWLRDNRK
jgi:NitT/TauT family transport system substrate-binding protein